MLLSIITPESHTIEVDTTYDLIALLSRQIIETLPREVSKVVVDAPNLEVLLINERRVAHTFSTYRIHVDRMAVLLSGLRQHHPEQFNQADINSNREYFKNYLTQ